MFRELKDELKVKAMEEMEEKRIEEMFKAFNEETTNDFDVDYLINYSNFKRGQQIDETLIDLFEMEIF